MKYLSSKIGTILIIPSVFLVGLFFGQTRGETNLAERLDKEIERMINNNNANIESEVFSKLNVPKSNYCYTDNERGEIALITDCGKEITDSIMFFNIDGKFNREYFIEEIIAKIKHENNLEDLRYEHIAISHSKYIYYKEGKKGLTKSLRDFRYNKLKDFFILLEVVDHKQKIRKNYSIDYKNDSLSIKFNRDLDYEAPSK
jgi:hypothetical protein